jgi:hypothetical protein
MIIKGIRDNKAWQLVNNFVLFVKSRKKKHNECCECNILRKPEKVFDAN